MKGSISTDNMMVHEDVSLDDLSRRQRQIAILFSDGMTYRDIATKLFISPSTVRNHLASIYRELGIRSKVELVRFVEARNEWKKLLQTETALDISSAFEQHPEQRQLTVMLCSLTVSAEQTALTIPSDTHGDCLEKISEIAKKFGGTTAEVSTDTVLLCFGYPQGYEDAAKQALNAGMLISAEISQKNVTSNDSLHLEIAVTTNTVLIENPANSQIDNIGHSLKPVLLGILDVCGASNTVVIDSNTRKLAGIAFDCEDLGEKQLVASSTLTRMWKILSARPIVIRFALGISSLTPLSGRKAELYLLNERWSQVSSGSGQVVLLSGEAGIGKSRIVHDFITSSDPAFEDPQYIQCSPSRSTTAFSPFVDYLEHVLLPDEYESGKLASIEYFVGESGEDIDTAVPLLAKLLSVALKTEDSTVQLSAERQRQDTIVLLCRLLLKEAHHQPQLIIIEDIQWLDPSSSALLEQLIDVIQDCPTLLILTARSEYTPSRLFFAHITTLSLNRLDRSQGLVMIDQISDAGLPNSLREHIVEHTDGVPLYIEEMTRSLIESGIPHGYEDSSRELGTPRVPTNLKDALLVRLDHQKSAKHIAQLGACIGREFSHQLLVDIMPIDEAQLVHGLNQLVLANLILPRGRLMNASYRFKHALVRDIAHDSLPGSRKQELHARIAIVLQNKSPELTANHPEVIAYHLTEAGLSEKAIVHWRQAGEMSVSKSNNFEAIEQLLTALNILSQLPEDDEHCQLELNIRLLLGVPQQAVLGYASQRVQENYERANQLSDRLGDQEEKVPVLRGLYVYHLMRGDLSQAHNFGQQLLDIAQCSKDQSQLLEAHFAIGQTFLFHTHALEKAIWHFGQGVAIYDAQLHGGHAYRFGQDPGVYCLQLWAFTLHIRGELDAALIKSLQARELAQKIGHPLSLASAHVFSAHLHQWRNEPKETLIQARMSLAIAEDQVLPFFMGWARLLIGWAQTEQQLTPDWQAMRNGLDMFTATNTGLGFTICSAVFASAQLNDGQIEEADETITKALIHADNCGEPYIIPELLRMQGLIQIANTKSVQGMKTLERALHTAEKLNGKYWQLRISIEIARQLNPYDKGTNVQNLLVPLVEYFAGDTQTPDLNQAQTLLQREVET